MSSSKSPSQLSWLFVFSTVLLVAVLQVIYWLRYPVAGSDLVSVNTSRYPLRLEMPASRLAESLPPAADPSSDQADENALALAEPFEGGTSASPDAASSSASARPEVDALLPVEYDLSRAGDGGDAISTSKDLIVNGRPGPPLGVKIRVAGAILVSRSEFLARMKAENIEFPNRPPLPDVEHVSFNQLRGLGLQISYDPVGDSIIMTSGS